MGSFEGPRGLKGYARIVTHGDETVELQESSSVLSSNYNGEKIGPFVWLRVNRGDRGVFAHLSMEDATELRDALITFLAQYSGDDVTDMAWPEYDR